MNVLPYLQPLDLLDKQQVELGEIQKGTISTVEPFKHRPTMVLHYQEGVIERGLRNVICEEEFAVYVNDAHLVNLVCSQAALRELAYGFLYSEQIIGSLDDVEYCAINEKAMNASFFLRVPVAKPSCITISSGFGGKVFLSSQSSLQKQCRILSGGEIDSTTQDISPEDFKRKISWVINAVHEMNDYALAYATTRGIHCSALFSNDELIACFEDIGRHNTFDKLAGHCLLRGIPTVGMFLTTTGRVSAEMMRKALRVGVCGVASLSGPTDAGIALAQESGILLVGYVGSSSAIIYSGMA